MQKREENIMSIKEKSLKELAKMPDSKIDYSDIPELGEDFWRNAKVKMPEKKKAISLRIDREVLTWFKSKGSGYQSRMSAVLKAYMNANKNRSSSGS